MGIEVLPEDMTLQVNQVTEEIGVQALLGLEPKDNGVVISLSKVMKTCDNMEHPTNEIV